ncbi:ExeA family protein [Dyella sp. 20L07]|uniref:ExeA family protein n=1 Tax=Dyella sp. 20L07 TaxID=3384240 RepID=UPI003D293AF7
MSFGRPLSKEHSPYRLYGILNRHRIAHADLRKAITFQAGKRQGQAIAPSTLSTLLHRRVWPTTIAAEDIQRQVSDFLAKHGVSAEEIADAWATEDGTADAGPPVGRPLIHSGDRAKAANAEPVDEPIPLPEPEMLSPAAKALFHLPAHPFVDDVKSAKDVFLSADQRYIRESMYYAAKHAGIVAVIGESGSGKTTLRRDMLDRIKREESPIITVQVKNIDKTTITAAHICDAIIADLSTERPKLSLEAKSRQVERILCDSARTGSTHVLIIEEAHDLSVRTIKYLKRFWELEDGFKKLLGIVLVGQPELANLLDERRNYEAREFIRRCEVAHLRPLNGNLEDYLKLKLDRVGVTLDVVFESDAYDAIRAKLTRRRTNSNDVDSQLYPLVVNNLVVKCMNQAAEMGLAKVSGELVGRV